MSPVNFRRRFPGEHRPPGRDGPRQLHIGDNWNPEPGAWPRMDEGASSKPATAYGSMFAKPAKTDSLADCEFAHLTGTSRFSSRPSDERNSTIRRPRRHAADRRRRRIDEKEFAESAEAEMKAMFSAMMQFSFPILCPGRSLRQPRRPRRSLASQPISAVRCNFAFVPERRRAAPSRHELADRMAVFFSHEA